VSKELPDLYGHLQANFVSTSLLTTDWVIGLFMNCLPLDLTASFLGAFFRDGWDAFYDLAVEVLRFHEEQILLLNDAGEIISTIKQVKHGCCVDNLMQSVASLSIRNQRPSVTISEIDDTSSAAAESLNKHQLWNQRDGNYKYS
jgi:hypothetical protein